VAITSRLLTPADVGLFAASALLLKLVSFAANAGITNALIHFENVSPSLVRTAFTLSACLGIAGGIAVLALSPLAEPLVGSEQATSVAAAMALSFPIAGLGAVSSALLRRQLRFKWLAAVDVASYFVGYIVIGVLLAFLGAGVWALVAAALAQGLTLAVTTCVVVRHPLRFRWDRVERRQVLGFGSKATLASFLEFWGMQVDTLAVSLSRGAGPLGLYTRGSGLVALPLLQIGTVAVRVFTPTFSRLASLPAVSAATIDVLSIASGVLLPTGLVLAAASPLVVDTLLGEQWSEAVSFLPFSIGAALCHALSQVLGAITEARGLLNQRMGIQGMTLAVFSTLAVGAALINPSLPAFAFCWLVAEVVKHLMYVATVVRHLAVVWAAVLRSYLCAIAVGLLPAAAVGFVAAEAWPLGLSLPVAVLVAAVLLTVVMAAAPSLPLRRAVRRRGLLSKRRGVVSRILSIVVG
jgi:O-antigen/teichoic acid export membrane protein